MVGVFNISKAYRTLPHAPTNDATPLKAAMLLGV